MRESNFPGLYSLSSSCPAGTCTFVPPSLLAQLRRRFVDALPLLDSGCCFLALPRASSHLCEGIEKSCCLCWIEIQTFCPKWAVCFKAGGSNGKRKRRLFERYVWLVALNGGVKLYKCEMLLLLFMNYPAPCLTLPKISFYWHMQSSAILWLLSLLQAYPQPQWGVQGPDASTGIWLTKMCSEEPEVCPEQGDHAEQHSWWGVFRLVHNQGEFGVWDTHNNDGAGDTITGKAMHNFMQ